MTDSPVYVLDYVTKQRDDLPRDAHVCLEMAGGETLVIQLSSDRRRAFLTLQGKDRQSVNIIPISGQVLTVGVAR